MSQDAIGYTGIHRESLIALDTVREGAEKRKDPVSAARAVLQKIALLNSEALGRQLDDAQHKSGILDIFQSIETDMRKGDLDPTTEAVAEQVIAASGAAIPLSPFPTLAAALQAFGDEVSGVSAGDPSTAPVFKAIDDVIQDSIGLSYKELSAKLSDATGNTMVDRLQALSRQAAVMSDNQSITINDLTGQNRALLLMIGTTDDHEKALKSQISNIL